MNIGSLAQVQRRRGQIAGRLRGAALRLPDIGPRGSIVIIGGIPETGQQHLQEREIPLSPAKTPVGDQIAHQPFVILRRALVGFALIPDHAPHRHRNQRPDHIVEQHTVAVRIARPHRLFQRIDPRIFKLRLEFPHAAQRDRSTLLARRRNPHLIRRAVQPAVVDKRVVSHRDHRPARFDQFRRNPVAPGNGPMLRFISLPGAPDLDAVEIGHVMLVDRAEAEHQLTPLPRGRDFDFAPEPDHAVDVEAEVFPEAGQFPGPPAGIVEFRRRPAVGHSPVFRFRRQDPTEPRQLSPRTMLHGKLLGGKRFPHAGSVEIPLVSLHPRRKIRIPDQRFAAGPRFGDRAAPVGGDDPDRHIQLPVQLAREEISDRRPSGDAFRPRHLPVGGDIGHRNRLRPLRHGQHAQLGQLSGFRPHRFALRRQLFDFQFHVGLSARDPDLSDEDVGICDRLSGTFHPHFQLQRPARRARREAEHEPAVVSGPCHCRNAAQTAFHNFKRFRPPPDRNRPIPLQDGVIAEQLR